MPGHPRPQAAHSEPLRKDRGTLWAVPYRFRVDAREAEDDGWGSLDQQAVAERLQLGTQVFEEPVKRILTANDSPDIGFDLSINPYCGCEHGCIYR